MPLKSPSSEEKAKPSMGAFSLDSILNKKAPTSPIVNQQPPASPPPVEEQKAPPVEQPQPELPKQEPPAQTVESHPVETLPNKALAVHVPLEFTSPGLVVADFGQKMSRYPINRFKATVALKNRIAIIEKKKVIITKTHFSQDAGNFYCFGGICCEREGLPNIRYALPIVVYDTDKNGVPVSANVDVQFLNIAQDRYDELISWDANFPIDTVDFLITCSDEQYQKYSLQNIGPSLWSKTPEVAKVVIEKYQKTTHAIPLVIARKLSEDDYIKAVKGEASSSPSVSAAQVTDLSAFLAKK